MKTLVILLALLLLAVPAWAVGPNVGLGSHMSWTAPTANADASPLVDLAGFEVLVAPQAGVTPTSPGLVIRDVGAQGVPATPPANTVVSITLGSLALTGGQKYACVRAYDLAGNRGACSNEVPFVGKFVAPGAPTGLTVGP